MKTTLSALTIAALSFGCQQGPLSDLPQLPDLRDDAREVVEDARARASELGELSAEELTDLWAIQYTTLEVRGDDLPTVDRMLNEMGRERWDCYHVSEQGDRRLFYFKRRHSNATTYLTNLLRAGALVF